MYNSQYYTCEQIDQRLLQGYLDDYNSQNNTSLTKAQFLTKLYNVLETYEYVIEDYLGSGFLYAGLATPTGTPRLPQDHQVQLFFIAISPGTYTNYGNITIANTGLHFILWDTTTWSYDTVLEIDQQTGQSTTKTMSQKAITDLLSLISDSNIKANIGYYVCDTLAATAAKTISATGYALFVGGAIKIKMTNANTADNATLNINSTGAKPLYYAGERASASNSWEAGETIEVYYDGTSYYANNVAGGSGSGDGAFDISAAHSGATYDNLAAALGTNGANVPASKRKGGMSVKFIQNIYATYSVVKTEGLDTEPTGTELQSASAVVDGVYTAAQLSDLNTAATLPATVGSSVTYYFAVSTTETVEEEEVTTTTYTKWVVTKVSNDISEYVQWRYMGTSVANADFVKVESWQSNCYARYDSKQNLSYNDRETLINNIGLKDAVDIIGGQWGDFIYGTPVRVEKNKYLTNSGTITNTSNPIAVAFYPITTNKRIDKINLIIPVTGSGGTYVCGITDNYNTNNVNIINIRGSYGKQNIEVDLSSIDNTVHNVYMAVCYNYNGSTPYFRYKEKVIDFSPLYKNNTYNINKGVCNHVGYCILPDGSLLRHGNFAYSDFLYIGNTTPLKVTCNFTTNSAVVVSLYNKDREIIAALGGFNGVRYINVPHNTVYIRLCNNITVDSNLSVEWTTKDFEGLRYEIEDLLYRERKTNNTINVLMIGNSFTENTLTYINSICDSIGITDINISKCQSGGASLNFWANKINSGTSINVTSVRGYVIGGGTIEKIFSANWDIIVFQQASTDSDTYSTYIPYLSQLVRCAREKCPNKNLKIAFNMTWETVNANYSDIVNSAKRLTDDFVVTGVIDFIIPCGTAIENIRNTSIAEGANYFSSDNSYWHLAAGVGCYVAGCAFYCSVIKPFTGISIYNDTTDISVSGGLGQVPVDSTNRILCQRCADYANVYKFGVTDVEHIN